jgi:hypothetical protein
MENSSEAASLRFKAFSNRLCLGFVEIISS